MPNPAPVQSELFKKKRFQRVGEIEGKLSKKVIGVKLPVDATEIIESMPKEERIIWLRNILTNAARKLQSPSADAVANDNELEKIKRENAELKRRNKELEERLKQQTSSFLVVEDYYTGVQLARRLKTNESRVRAARDEGRLEAWSKKYDPDGWTWKYDLRIGKYYPVE